VGWEEAVERAQAVGTGFLRPNPDYNGRRFRFRSLHLIRRFPQLAERLDKGKMGCIDTLED
jgi:hypothetical protein